MVPGMTERERLAADVVRLSWLADARFGPAMRVASGPHPPQAVSPLGAARRALAAGLLLGQRIRSLPSVEETTSAEPSPTPVR